jgi:hypothetical protein
MSDAVALNVFERLAQVERELVSLLHRLSQDDQNVLQAMPH